MPGVDLSDVVLPDDLQQALINRVESGQFPSKGALIEKALRSFLIEEPAQEAPEEDRATEPQPERLPSPFILDEWVFGPGDIPRSGGRRVRCRFLRDETRWPDRFPGE
jgi:Arc/MetJ-type ribon-helix-helix transcriptional regulator